MLMSQTHASVEWLLNEMKTYFKFVSLKPQMKIGLSTGGKICCVYDLLQNARTCLYGNHIFEFFQLDPSPLEDHFQLLQENSVQFICSSSLALLFRL